MKILAIETSCDETAICILETTEQESSVNFNVLANLTLSQAKLHAEYGGVFPNLAKREHSKNLVPILKEVLKESGLEKSGNAPLSQKQTTDLEELLERELVIFEGLTEYLPTVTKPEIDMIAVTSGPGLEPALWVGINFAKALSTVWNIPVVPINHMEGHLVSSIAPSDTSFSLPKLTLPALALLVSGGHTEIVLMRDPPAPSKARQASWMDYEVIGSTRDDAVGEAFDKVARMLELPYPGGPEISKLALSGKKNEEFTLPRPMLHSGDFDFSFSGLKTAVLYKIKEQERMGKQDKADMALAFEEAVVEILLKKTLAAIDEYSAQTLIIGGGVSANKRIRKSFTDALAETDIKLFIPEPNLSTDNALMIGIAGYLRGETSARELDTIRAQGHLEIA